MSEFLARAQTARDALAALMEPTPLQRNDYLSGLHGCEVWLKREDLTPVRSYKLRGAFNAMRKVRAARPEVARFVCASAGNHAQGVAHACRHFGVQGTIFMPVTTPEQKIGKTRAFGGDCVTVRLVGDYFDDTLRAAKAYCAETGGHFLSPFDDDDVIEGQATVALEILDQMPGGPEVLVLPVGGGGLSAGVTRVFRERAPATEIFYVEPAGGASLAAAVRAGAPVTLTRVDTFVDGAAVARVGERTFAVLRDVAEDHVLAVDEDRLSTTILSMLNHEGVVLEPAGALAVDALKDLRERVAGRRVVCVTSGGNFDFERLPEVKERAQRALGLKKYFILRLPQRPGALRDFLAMLGPEDDIARFEYLKKSNRNFGSVLLGIETGAAENFAALEARLTAGGFAFRDITADELLAEFLV